MKLLIKALTSLQLTIACLVFGIILIFVGTLAQVNLGIHGATQLYFYSIFVYWDFPDSGLSFPIFPGGYLIGGVLLVSLTAALFGRFKYRWNKVGILMTHIGVILLLLGELISSVFQVESYMRIDEGSSSNFSENQRQAELVIYDRNASEANDRVVSIPEALVASNSRVAEGLFPFSIATHNFLENSQVQRRQSSTPADQSATKGVGQNFVAVAIPPTGKTDEVNVPAVLVTITDAAGAKVGTWLTRWGIIPQEFEFEGKDYAIELRQKRIYYPFTIELQDFSHDRYLGTNIPKNFSSLVTLYNESVGEEREFLIYMNNPLRYQGHSFYQASFDNNDTTSIFQVVENPGRLMPYISCSIITLGMIVQFLISLTRFTNRRQKKS